VLTSECRVDARFHPLPAELSRFFTTFCFGTVEVDGDGQVNDAMQPEWGTLRFFPDQPPNITIDENDRLDDALFVVSGPTSNITEYTMGPSRFWGIGLLPLGWATFAGIPASDRANGVVDGLVDARFSHFKPLADILLDPSKTEQEQLDFIIDFFLNQAPRFGKEDPRIGRIHDCLMAADLPSVQSMADHCAMGSRTMERLCRKAFGFPPKLLLRRQRFMRSLSEYMLDPDPSWSASIDALYYDQSHFVRDSHHFLGMTPGEYAALDHPILSGFMRERVRLQGSPAQTLDKPST
jgi:AraC-like DNA-binding protein